MSRTYHTEFPDFGDLDVRLPAWLKDVSWKNDACPRFEGLGLRLWIDYKDKAKSEFPGEPRFTVGPIDADGNMDEHAATMSTDSWEAVQTYLEIYAAPTA